MNTWMSTVICCLINVHHGASMDNVRADVNAAVVHALGLLCGHALHALALLGEHRPHALRMGVARGASLGSSVTIVYGGGNASAAARPGGVNGGHGMVLWAVAQVWAVPAGPTSTTLCLLPCHCLVVVWACVAADCRLHTMLVGSACTEASTRPQEVEQVFLPFANCCTQRAQLQHVQQFML